MRYGDQSISRAFQHGRKLMKDPEDGGRAMRNGAVIRRFLLVVSLALFCPFPGPAKAQEAQPSSPMGTRPNELVAGKLVFVEEMPDNLDAWIADGLRRWGKYHVTANQEGADLVIEAEEGKRKFPGPRLGTPGTVPLPHRNHKNLPVASISVVDWVTNTPLFTADFVNMHGGNKHDPASSHITVRAAGYSAQQIATRFISQLQEYLKTLAAPAPGGDASSPSSQH
jgi:hypothetical protein